MPQRYLFLFLLIVITGCSSSEQSSEEGSFFSLKKYFQEQAALMKVQNLHLDKTIIKDGKEESKSFSNIDWNKELHPFEDADINKPAWKNAYSRDTVKSNDGVKVIYTALEKKLAVRRIEILLRNDSLQLLKVEMEKQNSYYTSRQSLLFEPGKGYSIKGYQKVILADAVNFDVKAIFKN